MRANNLSGKALGKECARCITEESIGKLSFRQGELKARGNTLPADVRGPKKIQFMISSTCNNACLICRPEISSLWNKYADEPVSQKRILPKENNIKEVLQHLDLSDLTSIQFRGGEPFLEKWHSLVLELLLQDKNVDPANIDVWYWTNGTRTDDKVFELWKKFKNVFVYFSIDDVGEGYEYQRWPSNWKQTNENIDWYFERSPSNVYHRFERTVNLLNIHRLKMFDEWHKTNYKQNAHGSLCETNTHFADDSTILRIENITDKHRKFLQNIDIGKINTMYKTYAIEGKYKAPNDPKQILYFISNQDKKRNNNVSSFFPEFLEMYQ